MRSYRFNIEGTIDCWMDADELEHRIKIAFSDEDYESSSSDFELHDFDRCAITEICPHDNSVLVSRIFDVDGTILEEHAICLQCGYGSPAMN